MFKSNHERTTNLRQSGNSAASQNYEQRSSINIRAPGTLGGEGPGDNGNGGVCHVHFERARRDHAIHGATNSGSFRRPRLVGATCAGCVASRRSSVGYEILKQTTGDVLRRIRYAPALLIIRRALRLLRNAQLLLTTASIRGILRKNACSKIAGLVFARADIRLTMNERSFILPNLCHSLR